MLNFTVISELAFIVTKKLGKKALN